MVKTISNRAELERVMEVLSREVMEAASEEILEVFREEYVEKYVYEPNNPRVYPRTRAFKRAWKWSTIKKFAGALEMEMAGDYSSLGKSPDHTSPFRYTSYSKFWPPDTRFELEKYLNKEGPSSSHPMSRLSGKAYWDIFIRDMFNSNKLEKIINKHARAKGLIDASGIGVIF